MKLHPPRGSDAAHLFNLLSRGFRPGITVLSPKGCFCTFTQIDFYHPITMYNELNVKEKEKDACLIWPKMMVFFIPTFFFKYD